MGRSGQGSSGKQPVRGLSVPGSIAWHEADTDEVLMAADALFEIEHDLGTTLVYIERVDGHGDEASAVVRGVTFRENGMTWDEPHQWDAKMFQLMIEKARKGQVRRAAYSTGWPWNWHQHVRNY